MEQEVLLSLARAIASDRSDVINAIVRHEGAPFINDALPGSVPQAHEGDTALHLACRLGKVDSVRTLLRGGARVEIKNKEGEMPFQLCFNTTHEKLIHQAFFSELLQNVCTGQLVKVERLFHSGIRVTDDGSPEKATLLHWAASFSQSREMIWLLVKNGADVNAKNSSGSTPAHEASAVGALEALEALAECGADFFTVKNLAGKTPRDLAKGASEVAFFNSLNKSASSSSGNQENITHHQNGHLGSNGTELKLPRNSSNASHLSESSVLTGGVDKSAKRKLEEQAALIDSLKVTVDTLLREHGVQDHVTRLQDHVGALTRQLAATAEQRDKLQNLYVASDRELERVARELALLKATGVQVGPTSPTGSHAKSFQQQPIRNPNDLATELEELRAKCSSLSEELERERKEQYASARLHLTYEADLRAEIKALQEQMLSYALASNPEKPGGLLNYFF